MSIWKSYLIYGGLVISFCFLTNVNANPACDDIIVKANIKDVEENHKNVDILISSKNKYDLIQYYFFRGDQTLVSNDFKSNILKNVPTGRYYCIVIFDSECIKRVDFEIN